MPVVSPSRYSTSTASTLASLSSGTYRSPYSSTSLDKPYYRSGSGTYVTSTIRSTYGDRTTEYRSRYSDIDGKRERKSSITEYSRSSRAPSITESDSGISTRYRSERSESRSRDLSSTRSDSAKCNSDPLPRNPAGTLARRNVASTASLASSAADLYNKYSPANYIPLAQRLSTSAANQNSFEISRSKSISSDIGRPPAADSRSSRKARNSVSIATVSERPTISTKRSSSQGYKEHSPSPSFSRKQNGIDPNGNEVQPSVSEIRRRFDPKMTVTKLPANDSRYIKTSAENYVNQLKNGTSSFTKVVPSNEKPVPVHLPSVDKYKVEGSRSNQDVTISKTTSEPLSLARPTERGDMSSSLQGKLSADRVLAVRSQLDPNNPIGKILEKSTVIKVDTSKYSDANSEVPVKDQTKLSKQTSNLASYIQNSRPIVSGIESPQRSGSEPSQNGEETVKLNGESKHDGEMKQNGEAEQDGEEELKYIDQDNRLVLNDIDSPTALESGFENKTFEHENYLHKREERRYEDEEKKMETSSESTGSDATEEGASRDAAPELAGGKSTRLSSERDVNGSSTVGKTKAGLRGLRNIGNTCFMNSVLQCLSNTRPLLEYVSDERYQSDINTTLSCMKGALIKAFATVIKELWREGESDVAVNTTALKSQVQRFAPRFMGYSQQDAQEFLRYLLEGLHEDVNRVTVKPKPILTEIDDNLSDSAKAAESWQRYLRMEESRVGDIFMGLLKSTLRCTHCQHASVTFDPFWDLSLPIPSRAGNMKLQQCLQHFTREEELDGDEKPTCSKCGVRRKCVKGFTVQRFPRVLVVHLKRFSPTERFRGKLNVLVEFPLSALHMAPYAANKGQEATYNLYAVSNHSGTTYSGHYTAYCKHPYSGDWYEYNDSRVSPISPRSVVSSEAYVLFYELASGGSS